MMTDSRVRDLAELCRLLRARAERAEQRAEQAYKNGEDSGYADWEGALADAGYDCTSPTAVVEALKRVEQERDEALREQVRRGARLIMLGVKLNAVRDRAEQAERERDEALVAKSVAEQEREWAGDALKHWRAVMGEYPGLVADQPCDGSCEGENGVRCAEHDESAVQ